MKKYLLLFSTILFFRCSNSNVTPMALLDGKWVERVNRRDTIIFDQRINSNDKKYFYFKSGNGISGYNDLYAAIYEYKIRNDKISIYNTLSSCYCFSDYRFTRFGDKLFIENFYDVHSGGEIETFEKLP